MPVFCLDRLEKPDEEFTAAQDRANPEFGGSLHYRKIDIRDEEHVNHTMADIVRQTGRLDGLVAAAGVNHIDHAIKHSPEDVGYVMGINYGGAFIAATAAAKQMFALKCRGTVLFIGSMSGVIANKGMLSPVYNSSKAAVVQLTRNLAMEWGKVNEDGTGGIRVNCLSPGHIVTPMVRETLEQSPGAEEIWKNENMLGRLAKPEEFRGAALFLMSEASSFMTGANLLVDGGHTAW
jgi:NAD(P)-dependent dehydrogenase (short-subunit alcohol dehydrogenase family)